MMVTRDWWLVARDWWLVTKRLGDIRLLYRHFERSEKSSLQADKQRLCDTDRSARKIPRLRSGWRYEKWLSPQKKFESRDE